MVKNKFSKDSKIIRTSQKSFRDYSSFESDLRNDFHNRCGYCGSSHDVIQTFEIDHFIPRAQFEGRDDSLANKYSNLVYCCRKCNRTKSDKHEEGQDKNKIENVLFYDPGSINYNDIFYRDRYGFIKSDDEKGKKTIANLKLYNPIYGIAWLIEEIGALACLIKENEQAIKQASSMKGERISSLLSSLQNKYIKLTVFLNNNLNYKAFNK